MNSLHILAFGNKNPPKLFFINYKQTSLRVFLKITVILTQLFLTPNQHFE